MSTQPDGVNDLLSRDLQAAMAVAGRWGEMMARQRAEQLRQRVTEQQHRRRELEERFEAERAVMRTELAPVETDRFWENAKSEDIAARYGLARQWEHHDEVARTARTRIEGQVKERHGLSVEDYLEERTPEPQRTESVEQEAVARETVDAQRDHAAAARNAAVAAQGDLHNDTDTRHAAAEAEELWDSGDRRAHLANNLMAALGGTEEGRDGVQARLAAERDQGTPAVESVRSTQRAPKARKNTGRGAGRERDKSEGTLSGSPRPHITASSPGLNGGSEMLDTTAFVDRQPGGITTGGDQPFFDPEAAHHRCSPHVGVAATRVSAVTTSWCGPAPRAWGM